MTTIIYKDDAFYYDSLVTENDRRVGSVDKVWSLSDGRVVALAGWLHLHGPMTSFLLGKASPEEMAALQDKDAGYNALVWLKDCRLAQYRHCLFPDYTHAPYHAIGTGAALALGALDAGAGPFRALEIACERDIYSGGRLLSYDCKTRSLGFYKPPQIVKP